MHEASRCDVCGHPIRAHWELFAAHLHPLAPTAWELGKQFNAMFRYATRPRRVLRHRGTKKGR